MKKPNGTYVELQLADGNHKYSVGEVIAISESDIPDDNIGGAALLPLATATIDGESATLIADDIEVGERYVVREVPDDSDPNYPKALTLVNVDDEEAELD